MHIYIPKSVLIILGFIVVGIGGYLLGTSGRSLEVATDTGTRVSLETLSEAQQNQSRGALVGETLGEDISQIIPTPTPTPSPTPTPTVLATSGAKLSPSPAKAKISPSPAKAKISPPAPPSPIPTPSPTPTPTPSPSPSPSPQPSPSQLCSFGQGQNPSREGVTLNEVAWMGNTADSADEWIELRNITSSQINLNGWQLVDNTNQLRVIFGSSDTLPANGFYLLERTSDNSVPNVTAQRIYTGALTDTNEGLELYSQTCGLIDQVMAIPNWPAGDNAAKKTMERDTSGFSWHTSSATGGTPAGANAAPAASPTPTPSPSPTPSPTPSPSPSPTISNANHLVISEIQLTGGSGFSGNDFIEIYNPTSQAVDISGWGLRKSNSSGTESSIIQFDSGSTIPARGFFLWMSTSYLNPPVTPDATTGNFISDNNSIVLRNNSGANVDAVTWESNPNSFGEGTPIFETLGTNQSYERKAWNNGSCISPVFGPGSTLGNSCDTNNNASDFEMRSGGSNPQNSSSPAEP